MKWLRTLVGVSKRQSSDGDRNFHLGATAQGVWGTVGDRGRSPPEAESVCRHCLHIVTTETIKIEISHKFFLILDQYASRWGRAKRYVFPCLAPPLRQRKTNEDITLDLNQMKMH